MARQILQLQGSLEAIESDKEGEDIMQRISWQQQELLRKQQLLQRQRHGLLPKEADRIQEEEITAGDDDANCSDSVCKKNHELRISYLNGVQGAMDDIEYHPSSSEDEVNAAVDDEDEVDFERKQKGASSSSSCD